MNKQLKEKTREALTSVLPITAIVLVLSVFIVEMPIGTMVMFLAGAVLLILGMGFFTLGADMSMMPMGEGIGVELTKTKKLGLVVLLSFVMGFIITIAEPDLQVLADQVPAIDPMVLIMTVAAGVGIFLALAIVRTIFKIKLSQMLIFSYALVFLVAYFTPGNFLAVAFDSGGVTTGPITVPFIMAMGLGLASIRSDKNSQDDSFGFIGLSSIGPILAVLVLGILYNPQEASYTPVSVPDVVTLRDVVHQFVVEIPHYLKEVALSLLPIVLVFLVFQLLRRRYKKRQLIKITVGLLYTYVGLVLFLTGVNIGFIPVGNLIGSELAGSAYKWLLIPVGMLIGYFIVAAEPSVHVLNRQVEEVSNGAIPASAMNTSLSIGVALSLGLAMLRILTGISIMWFLIPGYLIALVLTWFVPKIFTGIAFDAGGVATGPMTSTFLLPFAIGACEAVGGNVLTDAFGVVAMVAMTPIITVQLMGLVYTRKAKRTVEEEAASLETSDDIIEYDDETGEYADEPATEAEKDAEKRHSEALEGEIS